MEEFAKKIIAINEGKWGKRIAVSVQKFEKNNGLVLTGLCFEERENKCICLSSEITKWQK